MANGPLTEFEILQGTLSLTITILGILIGLIIILKYFQYKRKELLGVGFAILLTTLSWMPSGISFLSFIFSGVLLNDALYIFLAYGLTLFATLAMMYAIISLLFPKPAKKIILVFLTVAIVFEVIFVYLILFDLPLAGIVGTEAGRFDSEAGRIPLLMIIIALAVSLVIRILLIREFSKSENKKLQWRGRFILIEFILLIIGAFMDAALPLTAPILILARTLLVLRLLFLYLGWLLPDRVANWLIKEKE
ncbi:MAG: hypothetical protein ACFFAH_01840 [Promethearchaeota archaeon]